MYFPIKNGHYSSGTPTQKRDSNKIRKLHGTTSQFYSRFDKLTVRILGYFRQAAGIQWEPMSGVHKGQNPPFARSTLSLASQEASSFYFFLKLSAHPIESIRSKSLTNIISCYYKLFTRAVNKAVSNPSVWKFIPETLQHDGVQK